MKRSTFLKLSAGAIGAATLTGAYTYFVEPFWLEFVHRPLPIKNLPQSLNGKILMQISDIHAGDEFPLQYIKDSFFVPFTFRNAELDLVLSCL